MYTNKCERCHKETLVTTMSYFNTQMICSKCEESEQADERYEEARKAENAAVMKGDYNFKGIGL